DQSPHIFHDPHGKRWKKVKRFGGSLLFVSSIIGALLCITVILLPMLPSMGVFDDRQYFATPHETKSEVIQRMLARRAHAALLKRIRAEASSIRQKQRHHNDTGIVAGFYVNWEPNSFESLRRHIDALSYVMPEWLSITPDDTYIKSFFAKDTQDPQVIELAEAHHVPIVPIVNNINESGFQWEPLKMLLADPKRQQIVAVRLRRYLTDNNFAGINLDLEAPYEQIAQDDLPEAHRLMHEALPKFVETVKREFAPYHLLVTEDVHAQDSNLDYQRLADLNDFIIIMLYDQHVPSGDAGPIASETWVESRVEHILADADESKVVLGLANYCYDWPVKMNAQGQYATVGTGRKLLQSAALNIAQQANATIQMDDGDLNPYFTYQDEQGQDHLVYMLDAVTLHNEITALRGYHARGVALWYLGSEDPTSWSFLDRNRIYRPHALQQMQTLNFHDMLGVDTSWQDNELMKIVSIPQPGQRRFTTDEDGIITDETFDRYPMAYVVNQNLFHAKNKVVALTFDDGPDPVYTPQILRILQQHHIHATFFVIGEAAAAHPHLVRQAWLDGNEIGNHTYTHPHIVLVSPLRAELELNATERVIESITGHSTLLFRPPFGESPDTGSLSSMKSSLLGLINHAGYIMVGMNIDPKDYLNPPSDEIVEHVEQQLRPANHVILLHDSGGDRRRTVAALPKIIENLQRQGYQFVTVSQLIGPKAHQAIFPVSSTNQHHIALFDMLVFSGSYYVGKLFIILFLLGIVLGIIRLVLFSILIAKQHRRSASVKATTYQPHVTMVIPAYNEEQVICRTVSSALASDYPDFDVIVVDDGSTDATYEQVRQEFGDNPRVTIIRKENGGKSTALNLAFARATGEIVMCIDADTMLAPTALGFLVRHFADPRVGAVAGNVKVGNRVNALTIWQSIEYITNQNFDRQAFSFLRSVPVVPGAIGAWRREVVLQAGGFEANTLAEDTDLTFKVRLLGYHTICDNRALAYTEAPDGFSALARQRFRWSFGILQALWKHRRQLLKPQYGAFSCVVMPSMWIYNFALQVLAPFVDL
ncbi:MAG TPA: glycosyltransferase, partial [Armatimonadota bacterium]|nr:glycosyltransferase [Armatimonadota bacterium]